MNHYKVQLRNGTMPLVEADEFKVEDSQYKFYKSGELIAAFSMAATEFVGRMPLAHPHVFGSDQPTPAGMAHIAHCPECNKRLGGKELR